MSKLVEGEVVNINTTTESAFDNLKFDKSPLYKTMEEMRPDFIPMPVKEMTLEQKLMYNAYLSQLLAHKLSRAEIGKLVGVTKTTLNSYITREKLLKTTLIQRASEKGRKQAEMKLATIPEDGHLEQLKQAMVVQQLTIAEGNKTVLKYMKKHRNDLTAIELAHLNKSLK